MTKIKSIYPIGLLATIAIVFLISSGNLRADYQQDQDTQRAAQQLKDTEDAEQAADKRSYDSQHPHFNGGGLGATIIVMLIVAAPIVFILSKSK